MAITKTDYVTFTVFAVPETIEGLTLVFHLGEDGSEEQTATLKMREGNETEDISFTGCKKHYLRGIAVKGGWNFKYLTLESTSWTGSISRLRFPPETVCRLPSSTSRVPTTSGS